jgi:preprotein translocase subunit SecB
VFRLTNIPQENLGPLLMIECPRLLFPFAREIISSAISNGGFPPLLLHPIDFVGLYQRKLAEMQAGQQPTQVG